MRELTRAVLALQVVPAKPPVHLQRNAVVSPALLTVTSEQTPLFWHGFSAHCAVGHNCNWPPFDECRCHFWWWCSDICRRSDAITPSSLPSASI